VVTGTSVLVAGRYRLEGRIAAGGVGEVWKGTDEVLGRPVAVKLLRAEYAQHPRAVARFRAEARHASALSHPGIAQVYDYGEAGAPYLVMELVGGPSLAQVLRDGPLDPGRVMDVVAQAAAGLQAAHGAGLVHRDIKPGNLLVGPGGQVKITDFGICYAAGSAPLTGTGALLGTPAYLAPERVAGQGVTAASDLYSLGVVAWECLAGTPPFTGAPVEVAIAHRDRPVPPLPGTVPAGVAALVAELTAKDPLARPPGAGVVAERAGRLRDALNSRSTLPLVVPPDPVGPARWPGLAAGSGAWRRAGRWPGKAVALAAVGFIAAVIGGAALASSLSHAPSPPPTGTPSASAARTVEVGSGSLAGQPVGVVRHRLEQLGLLVRVRWQPSGQDPGTVLAVQPSGPVPAGSVVVITAASQPQQQGDGHGNGNGDGHGNGKGGGHGNGDGGD
jgi:eukaryotic-like serine/threonine-protein kinase